MASTASFAPGSRQRRRRPRVGSRRAAGVAGRHRAQLAADRHHVAGAQRDVHQRGDRLEHPAVGHRRGRQHGVEGPQPALPVHERAGLLDRRRDRQHHVGPPGHRAAAQLQADQEADRCPGPARPAAGRPGRPGRRRRPAGRRACRRRPPRRSRRCPGRPCWAARPPSTSQASESSARAAGSATGRPPGSRLGRQPASTAPRSPARRGTQARRAPVRAASAAAAERPPGTSARRSPTISSAPGALSAAATAGSSASSRASSPGTAATSVAPSLLETPGEVRRDRGDLQLLAAVALAQPQEEDRALLLRLEPDDDRDWARSPRRRT